MTGQRRPAALVEAPRPPPGLSHVGQIGERRPGGSRVLDPRRRVLTHDRVRLFAQRLPHDHGPRVRVADARPFGILFKVPRQRLLCVGARRLESGHQNRVHLFQPAPASVDFRQRGLALVQPGRRQRFQPLAQTRGSPTRCRSASTDAAGSCAAAGPAAFAAAGSASIVRTSARARLAAVLFFARSATCSSRPRADRRSTAASATSLKSVRSATARSPAGPVHASAPRAGPTTAPLCARSPPAPPPPAPGPARLSPPPRSRPPARPPRSASARSTRSARTGFRPGPSPRTRPTRGPPAVSRLPRARAHRHPPGRWRQSQPDRSLS